MDATLPVFGTRGVEDGLGPGNPEHDRSPTLRLHGPRNRWVGNICFNDNHTETWGGLTGGSVRFDPGTGPRADNIFSAEFEHAQGNQAAADAFLGVFISATQFTVEDVYDPLE